MAVMDVRRARQRRHKRVTKRVHGVPSRPRLCVFRSLNHIYGQVIDDTRGHTLVSASTMDPEIRDEIKGETRIKKAEKVGSLIGKRTLEREINRVVFDRGGYKYHGRVKALAEAARETGLIF